MFLRDFPNFSVNYEKNYYQKELMTGATSFLPMGFKGNLFCFLVESLWPLWLSYGRSLVEKNVLDRVENKRC